MHDRTGAQHTALRPNPGRELTAFDRYRDGLGLSGTPFLCPSRKTYDTVAAGMAQIVSTEETKSLHRGIQQGTMPRHLQALVARSDLKLAARVCQGEDPDNPLSNPTPPDRFASLPSLARQDLRFGVSEDFGGTPVDPSTPRLSTPAVICYAPPSQRVPLGGSEPWGCGSEL